MPETQSTREVFDSLLEEHRDRTLVVPRPELAVYEAPNPADWTLNYFRQLSIANGFTIDKSPRDTVLVAKHDPDKGYMVVRNQYRGITDTEVGERRHIFADYQALADEVVAASDPDQRKQRKKEAQDALRGTEEGGVQGVEDYTLVFTPDQAIAEQVALGKLSVALATLMVSHTHHLPDERTAFRLPTSLGNFETFKYLGPPKDEATCLWVNNRRYSLALPDQAAFITFVSQLMVSQLMTKLKS